MDTRSLKYLVLATPFLLGGCGEGWEMVKTDTMFPYGNMRTAGSGVSYVRANMLPERKLNLEPAKEVEKPKAEAPPPPVAEPDVPEPEPVEDTRHILDKMEKDMDKIFDEAQQK